MSEEEAFWVVDGETPPSKKVQSAQLNYASPIVVNEDAPEGQKEFARVFNEMRDALLLNKLMKSK